METLSSKLRLKRSLHWAASYLALQEEENQHPDEIPIGTAPPSPLSQSFFSLWVMATEQPGVDEEFEVESKEESCLIIGQSYT